MKKVGLKDMKKRNSQLILRSVTKLGPLSRVEISRYTELSPSTVTGLVNVLIEKGLLIESGFAASTGGRKRIELSINGAYGDICIIEISRTRTLLHLYSINLDKLKTIPIYNRHLSGNELLESIRSSIKTHYQDPAMKNRRPMGFGLLFQEDVQPSDYNVMFSTSLSSASITLGEALLSQFRVPVVEEHTGILSLSEPLQTTEQESANSAHINIGNGILVGITLDGKPLSLKKGRFSDFTSLFPQTKANPPQGESLEEQITTIISFLCTLFPLDTILLSGKIGKSSKMIRRIRELAETKLTPEHLPKIQVLETDQQPVDKLLASIVRDRVLETISL